MPDAKKKSAILGLVKKEFFDKFRNKWVIAITLLWIGLIIFVSIVGSYGIWGVEKIESLEFVVEGGSGLIQLLIPIIAIILGYKTIAEEVDSKTIGLLFTSNLDRTSIVMGKFLALFSVLAISIVGGLGAGGLVIGFSVGFGEAGIYLGFVLLSLLFGATYIAISMAMSSVVTKVSRALAGGVFIWLFFHVLWNFIRLALFYATGNNLMRMAESPPDWYSFIEFFNPNNTFSMAVNRLLGRAGELPSLIDIPLTTIVLILWIVIPILLGLLYFQRRDF